MTKAADTRKQQRNDFEARMKMALPDDRQYLIDEIKKCMIKTRAPDPYNAGLMKAIDVVRNL